MYKLLTRFAAILALLGASFPVWAAGEVQLVHARSHGCAPAPSCQETADALIEVQNLASTKKVGVRYRTRNGVWANAEAFYVTWPAGAGKQLWFAALPGGIDSFAIFYTVNGVTYWDNNGGRNYGFASYQNDAVLGKPAISNPQGRRTTTPQQLINGEIWVKNLSYSKVVRVVYTDNNWATTKEVFARYVRTYPSGVEAWSFSAPLSSTAVASQIQMAFQYSWTGGSAWDNNGGRNYVINSQNVIARGQ